jgi:hypothetical protein
MVIETKPFNVPRCKNCGWEGAGHSPSAPGEIDYGPEKCPECGGELEGINCLSGGPEFKDPFIQH